MKGIIFLSPLLLLLAGVAQAELVFDDGQESQVGQLQGRSAVRQQVPAVQQADIAVGDAHTLQQPTLSRSELLRRKRLRQEIQNEDLLQASIEELRLRAEEQRTQAITHNLNGYESPNAAVPLGQGMPQEQVGSYPNQQDRLVVEQAAVASAPKQAATSQVEVTESVSAEGDVDDAMFTLSPRFGVSELSGGNSFYDIDARFAAGLAVGVETKKNVGFELAYTYAEYGMALLSSSNTVRWIEQNNLFNFFGPTRENIVMKQNVIEGIVKMNLLDRSTVFRPFLGAGAGYAKSFVNYDSFILQNPLSQQIAGLTTDYKLDQFIGSVTAGFDVRLSRSISVAGLFKYSRAFSSRENAPLNNGAFFRNGFNRFATFNANSFENGTFDKSVLAGTAAQSDFYTIQGGLTFRL